MIAFNHKSPVHYEHPYRSMQKDIDAEIASFKKIWKKPPNYIVLHTDDYEELLAELQSTGYFPPGKTPAKFQYCGTRVMRSPDMDKGWFDVVGN